MNTDQNGLAQTTLRTSQTATVTASVGATAPQQRAGGRPAAPATGSTSGQASATVTVGVAASPTLVITPPTTPPSVGLPATFTFAVTAATTNGSAVRDLSVNWGDGTTQDLGQVSGTATATHVFRNSGTYVITGDGPRRGREQHDRVDVDDGDSSAAADDHHHAVAGAGKVNTQTTLQIQVTLPSGISVQDLSINFGDGQSADLGGATSASVPHVYTTTGNIHGDGDGPRHDRPDHHRHDGGVDRTMRRGDGER